MSVRQEKKLDRRNLFTVLGRIVSLGSLLWIGRLTVKSKKVADSNPNCVELNPCQTCKSLNSCELPQSMTAKRTIGERDDE